MPIFASVKPSKLQCFKQTFLILQQFSTSDDASAGLMCSAQRYLQSSYRMGKESDAGVIFSFFLSVFMSSRLYLCLLSKPASETFGSAKHFNTVNHSESVPRSLCLTRCSFSFRQSSYSGHSFTLVWLLFFSPGHWNKARPTLQQPWNFFFFFFTRLAVVQGIVEIPQLMEQELALLFNFTHLSFDNNRTKVACRNFAFPYFRNSSVHNAKKEALTFH